jgi:histidinol-phosphate aminotransferase
MGRFFDLVNKPVHELGAYASGMPTAAKPHGNDPTTPLIKLNANESPYGPSPKAVAAMRAALEHSHWYPDDLSAALRQKLAELHDVRPDQILVGNGTTSLLGIIARTLLGPGRNAVTSACSFISYPMVTKAVGATLIETPLRNNGYDLDAMRTSVNSDTRVVFIANPNNPTGTVIDADTIDRFLEGMPEPVIVVLDEAYCDYAQHFAAMRSIRYSRSLDYVREDRNVIVLRTFSKAHGLAGVRVGYGIGPTELIAYFARMQDTFAVSSPAQAAALAALDDEAHLGRAIQNNAEQAAWMTNEIAKLGYDVPDTWTNFLFLDVKQDAREFARKLRGEGVMVRPLGAWGAPHAIRVTIGTAEDNQFFLRALQAVAS